MNAKTGKTAAKRKTTSTAAKSKKKVSKGSVVKIEVSLNVNSKPNVVLKTLNGSNARSMKASSGDTIEWQVKGTGNNIEMHDLSPTGTGEAFQNKTISNSKKKLSCEYTPTSSDPNAEFSYTLKVKAGKTTYNTNKPPQPGPQDDKPVIRN